MMVFCILQAGLGIFSTSIMRILVDNKFYISHTVIPITCMGYCFHALYTFITVAAYTKNKTIFMVFAYAVPVTFKFVASYFFIKHFGYIASAWIITFTYTLFALTCYLLFRNISKVHFEFGKLSMLFFSCGTAMAIASHLQAAGFSKQFFYQVGLFVCLIALSWFGPLLSREERFAIISESRRYIQSKFHVFL